MNGLLKTTEKKEVEEEFSFKNYFVPLTTAKAITWIVVIGLIVFCNGLFNGFVEDDTVQIGPTLYIHTANSLIDLFRGSTFINFIPGHAIGVYYKPVTILFFSFIYTIFGSNAFPFHLFQIFIYIFNCCLLFFFLKQFLKLPVAFLLSLIFLVHPINSEVALYISDSQELLFFIFGMVALLSLSKITTYKGLLISSLFLFISLLSKETGILFYFSGIIYLYLFRKKYVKQFIFTSIITVFLYSLLRIHAIGFSATPSNAPIDRIDWFTRLFNIPEMFLFYIKIFFLPFNLSSSYQWVYKNITIAHFFLPLCIVTLCLAIIFFLGIHLYQHKSKYFKIYLFFSIWFLIGIGMHMQIIPLDDTVSERWFYFPIVGLLGIIGVVLQYFKIKLTSKVTIFVIVSVLIVLSISTFIRSYDWRNNTTIYTHDLNVTHSYILYDGLSSVMLTEGKPQKAELYAKKSIKIYPYFTNYFNLGGAYLVQGDYQNAKVAYFKSLKYFAFSTTYENIAIADVYSNQDSKQNIVFIQNSLKKYPQDILLLDSLAILEYRQDNKKLAKELIIKAYSLDQGSQTSFLYENIMANKSFKLQFATHE